jgi:hypothetical protein
LLLGVSDGLTVTQQCTIQNESKMQIIRETVKGLAEDTIKVLMVLGDSSTKNNGTLQFLEPAFNIWYNKSKLLS